jgi:hypothetical protein
VRQSATDKHGEVGKKCRSASGMRKGIGLGFDFPTAKLFQDVPITMKELAVEKAP